MRLVHERYTIKSIINEVKINKILGKITINYDKNIIQMEDIQTLFNSDDKEVLKSLFLKYKA